MWGHPPRGLALFTRLWAGQLVSTLGSGLTNFGLGVWVYQRTHSSTLFGLIALFGTLPGVLISPIAGVVVDRMSRKRVILLSDLGAGFAALVLALLVYFGRLEIWHIYIIAALGSTATAFQWPAVASTTSLLVPKDQLGRANGMLQFSDSGATILSPILAGALMGTIGLWGLILLDFVSFFVAVGATLLTPIPAPPRTEEGARAKGGLWHEAMSGFAYIRARAGLLGMLAFFLVVNFVLPITGVLVTPFVLSLYDAKVLGMVQALGGVGMLAGTLVMVAWGGPKRRVLGIPIFGVVCLIGSSLLLLPPSWPVIALSLAVTMLATPIVNGCSQAIWQSKVPADMQGRVFACRRMIAWSMLPLALGLAGPLADGLFIPAMRPGGALSGLFGGWFGTGADAGIRLLFVVTGGLTFLAGIGIYAIPSVRHVEDDLPDAVLVPAEATPAEAVPV